MSDDPPFLRDADQTRKNILEVALKEFAEYGLAGARVDRIARGTRTTKGMIYYHFGDKDGLYKAVLEKVYPSLRSDEEHLDVRNTDPIEALERIIDFTLDYHEKHEDFVRIVMIENINKGEHLRKTGIDSTVSYRIMVVIADILIRGMALGVFKREVTPVDLHIFYTSFCFYRVSNHHTVSSVLGINMLSAQSCARHRRMVKDAVIAYLASAD
ncbi:TetR/AcrR family transcriptional regulator [Gluconobacter oxydans]|uniref:TetR/AcrR family transcriptional regulator n=1 Tax=Gluconobacter oxydans TaxID=442 RepID=UPI0015589879|nr:TetR/AcrR family transcriptional regulator [Gluconobacter oxydans]